MKRVWAFFVSVPLFAATVPGRYIVEFSTEPVAAHIAGMGKRGLASRTAKDHRAAIHAEQDRIRPALARQQATILDRTDTVLNALIVSVPDAKAAALANLPGVKRVSPERIFHLVLDHALPLHHVPDAWNMVGMGSAGAGIKIGIIDTGIDNNHPGFQAPSLAIPSGFPLVNADSDLIYTNNKVIVARSYVSLLAAADPDLSARDRIGHGTATSMAAAGVMNTGPLATITGVAPQAWLGSYKIFGTPGTNDGATEGAFLKALDDAVADGMDVINISLGSDLAPLPANDPEVSAIESASALGVVVIASSGNNGPDPATVGSPATAPSAIAVGASNNDREFAATASLASGGSYTAITGSGPSPVTPITAAIVDVTTLDGNGMACGPLRAGSLNGAIALILRGVCTFEQKLDDAQAAGAVAALIYTDAARPDAIPMAVGAATLPALMVSYNDGITIQQNIGGSATATLDFSLRPAYVSPDSLTSFSSLGPSPDAGIKPDLVAVGSNMYTAAQSFDPNGELYDPSGYGIYEGTSFSSPLVAGAVALVKAARPGLTNASYRSLIVNNAGPISYVAGFPASAQQAGAGILNVSAALQATAAMAPVSISFGTGTADEQISRSFTVTNVGTATETYQLGADVRSGPVPGLSSASVTLDPGASATIPVAFTASGLTAGQYEGAITVTGANSGIESRLPYWYGVPSSVPAYITVVNTANTLPPGAMVSDAVIFHVADASGIVMPSVKPAVTVISGGGTVVSLSSVSSYSPGAFSLSVRLGRIAGSNVFRVTVGDLSTDITLVSQ